MIYKKFKEKIKKYTHSDIDLSLNRLKYVLNFLSNPQEELKCIHVAGTNGKGSVCSILSYILKNSGYRVGLFISPHVKDFTERIQVNNKNIIEKKFFSILEEIEPVLLNLNISYNVFLTEFELICVIAFLYFKNENCEIVVLETGLGGRLDATNIIKNPLFCVITSISKDHTNILGNNIEKIAFEKAGIIKSGCPVICGPKVKGKALEVIKKIANIRKSKIIIPVNTTDGVNLTEVILESDNSEEVAEKTNTIIKSVYPKTEGPDVKKIIAHKNRIETLTLKNYENIKKGKPTKITNERNKPLKTEPGILAIEVITYKYDIKILEEDHSKTIIELNDEKYTISLPGRHQVENVRTVFLCLELLKKRGYKIPKCAIKKALVEVKHPARLEILRTDPLIILDGAHNAEGIYSLYHYISTHFKGKKIYGILGLLKDKFFGDSLSKILPLFSKLVVVEVNNKRTFRLEEIYNLVKKNTNKVTYASNFVAAFNSLRNTLKKDDVLVIFGSLYLAEEVKKYL